MLTIPNGISLARLLCVPVFAVLILQGRDAAALAVLLLAGASDYVDGVLARRWDQVTRLGQLLDPAADRLYVTVALLGLGWRDVLPWELVAVVVARELVLTSNILVLRHHGLSSLPPHLVGKTATFALLMAMPLLLLAETADVLAVVVRPVAWALVLWGTGLYYWAAAGYLWQTWTLVRQVRRRDGRPGGRPGSSSGTAGGAGTAPDPAGPAVARA